MESETRGAWGLIGHVEDNRFYMNYSEKPLKSFKKGIDICELFFLRSAWLLCREQTEGEQEWK